MKCPCPICNGKGYVYNALGSFNEDCGHCQGTGKVRVEGEPMTNEEWFCSLSTYKKAILMANCYDAFNLDQYACNKHVVIEEWLKQPHKE